MATQLNRLLELLDEQEDRVRRAFFEFVSVSGESYLMDELVELIERGDWDAAYRILDSYIAQFANVLPEVMSTVGVATAAELAEALPDIAMAIGFDPTNPRAAELAAASRTRLIREFSEKQHEATYQAISRAIREGRGAQAIARAFRASLGLTATQEAWVARFRAQLEGLDRRALDRELRDRRYDRQVVRAIERKRPLTARQIDQMVMRYRARALAMRADTIARTEALSAYSQAREESLRQMLEQTGIDAGRVNRIWNRTKDQRTRDWHDSMQGQRRRIGEQFRDGHGNLLLYPGDPDAPAETRINCRCTLSFEVRSAADLVRAA